MVPKSVITGDVWVVVQQSGKLEESNKLLFALEQSNYTFTFGDNGSLNDDTFALYIDGELVRTMRKPSRAEGVEVPLISGKHTVALHGITAPDNIGTYYLTFPSDVSVVSGDATVGTDLTAGKVKNWVVDVQAKSNRSMRAQKMIMPTIIKEE